MEHNHYNCFNLFQLLCCFPRGLSKDTLRNQYIWNNIGNLDECLERLEPHKLLDLDYTDKVVIQSDIIDNLAGLIHPEIKDRYISRLCQFYLTQ